MAGTVPDDSIWLCRVQSAVQPPSTSLHSLCPGCCVCAGHSWPARSSWKQAVGLQEAKAHLSTMLLPQAPSSYDLAPLSWAGFTFRIHLLCLSSLWHVTLPRKAVQPASKAKRFCKAYAKVLRRVFLALLGVGEDFPVLRLHLHIPLAGHVPSLQELGMATHVEVVSALNPWPAPSSVTTPVHEGYLLLTVLLPFIHLPKGFAMPVLVAPCAPRQLRCCHQ